MLGQEEMRGCKESRVDGKGEGVEVLGIGGKENRIGGKGEGVEVLEIGGTK